MNNSLTTRKISPSIALVRVFSLLLLATVFQVLWLGCGGSNMATSRTSTSEEWRHMFDGSDASNYQIFGFPNANRERWTAENGVLSLAARPEGSKSKLDLIITSEPVGDFEFSFEWKMSPGGNGGIFYMVMIGPQTSYQVK